MLSAYHRGMTKSNPNSACRKKSVTHSGVSWRGRSVCLFVFVGGM